MKAPLAGGVPDGVCYQDLNNSIHRITIRMWVFIYSIDSLHHHNNEKIQDTERGQVTWKLFRLQFIWAK